MSRRGVKLIFHLFPTNTFRASLNFVETLTFPLLLILDIFN